MPLGYFTDSTPLTPLRDPFNVLVDGINAVETAVDDLEDSRALQTFRWANATERAAQTGMQAGDIGFQQDTNIWYVRYAGSWVPYLAAPRTYTPSISNFSLGNGTMTAYWSIIGPSIMEIELFITLGTTSSVSGAFIFTLPSGFTNSSLVMDYSGKFIDTSSGASGRYEVSARYAGEDSITLEAVNVAGTYAYATAINSNAPFSWASTDQIFARIHMRVNAS